jgi:hypothetical protein
MVTGHAQEITLLLKQSPPKPMRRVWKELVSILGSSALDRVCNWLGRTYGISLLDGVDTARDALPVEPEVWRIMKVSSLASS